MNIKIADIFVINLDSRPERWERFLAQANLWEEAFGVMPKRLRAVPGTTLKGYGKGPWFTKRISEKRRKSWGGKAGCILSHRNAIETAHRKNLNNILIVEDDAFLPEGFPANWTGHLKQLTTNLPEDWACLYFCSSTAYPPCRIIREDGDVRLIEASGALGAVTYLLNGRVLRNLLDGLPTEETIWPWVARHKTIDRWLSQNLMRFGKVYQFAPSLAGHNSIGSSDTSMTAENDYKLDFSLKDLELCESENAFKLYITLRLLINFLKRKATIFRKVYKKIAGL